MSLNLNKKFDRYPGLGAFADFQADLFFGRDREINELYNLVVAEKATVLFAQSGVGKSSLLNAGLIPKLKGEDLLPVNIRFKGWEKEESPAGIFLSAFSPFFSPDHIPYPVVADDLPVWEYIKACRFPSGYSPVILFDQFEELFNFSPAGRAAFIEGLAELLHSSPPPRVLEHYRSIAGELSDETTKAWCSQPVLKMIFSIRSDRLFELNEVSRSIPYLLRNRYELKPLTAKNAEDCIRKPAIKTGHYFETTPFDYSEDALAEIIEHLAGNNEEVESTQLQIVCEQIEKKVRAQQRPDEKFMVVPALYEGKEGLKGFVNNYYHQRLEEIKDTGDRELVENVLETKLIFNNRRIIINEQPLLESLNNKSGLLGKLLDTRILREDYFKGSKIYEISHDSLAAIITKARQEKEELKNWLQKKAAEEQEQVLKAEADFNKAKACLQQYQEALKEVDNLQKKKEAAVFLEEAIRLTDPHERQTAFNIDASIKLGYLYVTLGRKEESVEIFEKAKAKARQTGDLKTLGQIYEAIAITEGGEGLTKGFVQECYKQALVYFDSAAAFSEKARLSENLASLLEIEFEKRGGNENVFMAREARDYYRKSLEAYRIINDFAGIRRIENYLSRIRHYIDPFAYLTNLFTGEQFALTSVEKVYVGRKTKDTFNNVDIKEQFVSRRHITISPDGVIEDLQSLNGTTVNAQPLYYGYPLKIQDKDVITLANCVPLLYQTGQPEPVTIPAGCWGMVTDGKTRRTHFLQDMFYAVTAVPDEEGEAGSFRLVLEKSKQDDALLELGIIDDMYKMKFNGPLLPSPFAGQNKELRWHLKIIYKDYQSVERSYVMSYIKTGEYFDLNALSNSLVFEYQERNPGSGEEGWGANKIAFFLQIILNQTKQQ